MRINLRKAMDALFAGRDLNQPSLLTRQDGELGYPTVYSYGYHYPLAILLPGPVVYVNTKPDSVTTNSQRAGVREYLTRVALFEPTANHTIDHNGFPFAAYVPNVIVRTA